MFIASQPLGIILTIQIPAEEAMSNVTSFPTTKQRQGYANAAAVAKALLPDEPIFCFSAKELRDRANQFIKNFPGMVSYAVK
jgi:hypothetical protein